ncbi:hypothetical protein H0A71_11050 [Alcaligenaceae bacterium]|nr:hypothetical protein [Alcaligenaceae bacterium]
MIAPVLDKDWNVYRTARPSVVTVVIRNAHLTRRARLPALAPEAYDFGSLSRRHGVMLAQFTLFHT